MKNILILIAGIIGGFLVFAFWPFILAVLSIIGAIFSFIFYVLLHWTIGFLMVMGFIYFAFILWKHFFGGK